MARTFGDFMFFCAFENDLKNLQKRPKNGPKQPFLPITRKSAFFSPEKKWYNIYRKIILAGVLYGLRLFLLEFFREIRLPGSHRRQPFESTSRRQYDSLPRSVGGEHTSLNIPTVYSDKAKPKNASQPMTYRVVQTTYATQ